MKYTIENPKLVEYLYNPEEDNFTGVIKNSYGTIVYYENGKLHRTDGPAFICANGHKEWRIHNKYHREDGPAIEYTDGYKRWYYNNKLYGCNNDFTVDSWKQKCKLEIFK